MNQTLTIQKERLRLISNQSLLVARATEFAIRFFKEAIRPPYSQGVA
jgi:hypothetical protein